MASPIVRKEWQEQRWKLAFGTVMLLFFAGSLAASRVMSAREAVVGVWVVGGFILSLYSAMGVFAPEQANGTLTFLASKPLSPGKVFLCKWFFGWLNVAVPLVACGLLALLFEGRRIATWEYLVQRPLAGLMLPTMLYTLTCCLAPRRAGEAQVGFFGLIVLLACFLHLLLWDHIFGFAGAPLVARSLALVNPLYLLATMDPGQAWRANEALPAQLAVFALVMWVGYRKWQRSV